MHNYLIEFILGESTPAVKFSMPKTEEHCKDFNIENKEQVRYQ